MSPFRHPYFGSRSMIKQCFASRELLHTFLWPNNNFHFVCPPPTFLSLGSIRLFLAFCELYHTFSWTNNHEHCWRRAFVAEGLRDINFVKKRKFQVKTFIFVIEPKLINGWSQEEPKPKEEASGDTWRPTKQRRRQRLWKAWSTRYMDGKVQYYPHNICSSYV
jgi:hypothetical protein